MPSFNLSSIWKRSKRKEDHDKIKLATYLANLKSNIAKIKMPIPGMEKHLLTLIDFISKSTSTDEILHHSGMLAVMLESLKQKNSDFLEIDHFLESLSSPEMEKLDKRIDRLSLLRKDLKNEIELAQQKKVNINFKLYRDKVDACDKLILKLKKEKNSELEKIKDERNEKFDEFLKKIRKKQKDFSRHLNGNHQDTFQKAIKRLKDIERIVILMKKNNQLFKKEDKEQINFFFFENQNKMKLKALLTGEKITHVSSYKNQNLNNYSINHALEDLAGIIGVRSESLKPLEYNTRELCEIWVSLMLTSAGVFSGIYPNMDNFFAQLESTLTAESFGNEISNKELKKNFKKFPILYFLKFNSLASFPLYLANLSGVGSYVTLGLGLCSSLLDVYYLAKEIEWPKHIKDSAKSVHELEGFFDKLIKYSNLSNIQKDELAAELMEAKKARIEQLESKLKVAEITAKELHTGEIELEIKPIKVLNSQEKQEKALFEKEFELNLTKKLNEREFILNLEEATTLSRANDSASTASKMQSPAANYNTGDKKAEQPEKTKENLPNESRKSNLNQDVAMKPDTKLLNSPAKAADVPPSRSLLSWLLNSDSKSQQLKRKLSPGNHCLQ